MPSDADRDSDYREGLSPESRLEVVAQIWGEIGVSGYYGQADRVVVDGIERAVTEAMSQVPPEVSLAESLTFKALHLIAGNI